MQRICTSNDLAPRERAMLKRIIEMQEHLEQKEAKQKERRRKRRKAKAQDTPQQ